MPLISLAEDAVLWFLCAAGGAAATQVSTQLGHRQTAAGLTSPAVQELVRHKEQRAVNYSGVLAAAVHKFYKIDFPVVLAF